MFNNDSYVYVKNLHEGESDPGSKGCSSWREYWEKKSKKSFSQCSRKGCSSDSEDGAHVILSRGNDRSWYIVPLCKACNNPNNTEEFLVKRNDLVPINR